LEKRKFFNRAALFPWLRGLKPREEQFAAKVAVSKKTNGRALPAKRQEWVETIRNPAKKNALPVKKQDKEIG